MFCSYFQFSDISKEPNVTPPEPEVGLALAASAATAQPPPAEPVPDSQVNEKPAEYSADFEDAVDPPLLTSTLKTDVKDSDDEFDFDVPAAKADNGKTVRFSGGGDSEEQGKEALVPQVDHHHGVVDELKSSDASGQPGAVAAAAVPGVQDSVDVKRVVPEVRIQPASPESDDIQLDQVITQIKS